MVYVDYMFFFFKQKTAYEMRISDWSSDVCSSDLPGLTVRLLLGDRIADLFKQPVDVALRYGEPEDSSLVALPVAPDNHRVLCASPGYLARHGEPNQLERSEARRVGKECVSTCRSRWSPYN